jgi:hypothetical protein
MLSKEETPVIENVLDQYIDIFEDIRKSLTVIQSTTQCESSDWLLQGVINSMNAFQGFDHQDYIDYKKKLLIGNVEVLGGNSINFIEG